MAKENSLLPINAFYITWLRERHILQTTELIVYIMLLSRADSSELTCFPAMEKICEDCGGIDRRKAWKALQSLESKGFIKVVRNRGRPNKYFMLHFAEWRRSPEY
jgi:hypothetical protein